MSSDGFDICRVAVNLVRTLLSKVQLALAIIRWDDRYVSQRLGDEPKLFRRISIPHHNFRSGARSRVSQAREAGSFSLLVNRLSRTRPPGDWAIPYALVLGRSFAECPN